MLRPWKNIIDCFRFDLSAKPGQKWIIRKVWFSKKLPENFKNKQFETAVKLTSAPVELVEKRYDLLSGRVERIESVEKLFLSTFFSYDKLNVVDH